MDITSLLGTSSLVTADSVGLKSKAVTDGNLFQTILNGAIDNINNTNNLLSDAENAEISFAMGETENTHDLIIALQKASTALQYTIAVRDKFMEAYKEIMNMQI
ncbi:MAG: flagellar hook-basal body complex protein FliE [Lachnospiraceae bacterium]|nr:flagellar hook-basal body complex protein FliE [Lachnospiraceae bacterium]